MQVISYNRNMLWSFPEQEVLFSLTQKSMVDSGLEEDQSFIKPKYQET